MFSYVPAGVYPLLIAGVVMSMAGIALAYFRVSMAWGFGRIVLAASAGVIFVITLFHLVPDTIEQNNGLWMLAGLVLSLCVGRMIPCSTESGGGRMRGIISPFLLGLHSMADGIVYEVAISARGAEHGMLSLAGLALHEFPEGVAAFFLLYHAGVSPLRSAWVAVLLVGATTPVGVFLSAPLMQVFDQNQFDAMFGFVAGLLIAVVVSLLRVVASTMPLRVSVPSLVVGALLGGVGLLYHQH